MISTPRDIGEGDAGSAVSLLFAAGHRPAAAAIRELARKRDGFAVSFDPAAEQAGGESGPHGGDDGQQWLELLANGLTFDLVGLAPGECAPPPPLAHRFAIAETLDPAGLEAVTLRPGPHLAGGHAMIPVVRSLAWLAALLAQLEGVAAIAWHPARSWCGPGYFREGVLRWVEGGVFPGLGLAALAVTADGGMQSEGLALFIGQELRLEPELAADRAEGAKIAVRLLDFLVEGGPLTSPRRVTGPDGLALRLEPSANGRFVRVWRG